MLKCIFFGTPDFAAQTLKFLLDTGVEVLAVVSKPDRPKGRSGDPAPTDVKKYLLAEHPQIPLYQPEKASAPEFVECLQHYAADLFIVVAYGEIMHQNLLDVPRLACLNIHASLLPEYRGAAPIQRSIMDGKKETGVTIMHMVRKLDAGAMVRQVRVPIEANQSFGELHNVLLEAGCVGLRRVLEDFESGELTQEAQNEDLVTYASKIELEDCELDWQRPATELHNLVRGVNPFPGAWAWVQVRGKRLRLKVHSTLVREDLHGDPGQILEYGKEGFIIATGAGSLEFCEIQLQGKRRMLARDFLQGLTQEQLIFQVDDGGS